MPVDFLPIAQRWAGLRPQSGSIWGGVSGYFADPDGHLWEVAWNPHWELAADGRINMAVKNGE